MSLREFLAYAAIPFFAYFVLYMFSTLILIGLSLFDTVLARGERGAWYRPRHRELASGITLVAPAHNEGPVIVSSVNSFLACDYEPYEVVIVDDGSTDDTLAQLVTAFDLVELPVGDRLVLPSAPIEKIYVSRRDPRLRVVRKQNGGRSDAINAGLNVAYHELVATVDSDSLLEPDALDRAASRFAADPERVIAVGGTIRIANGAVIENGQVIAPHVPTRGTAATQVAEYLRGFLGTRIAWSRLNGLLIISGAFGLFRRDLILEVGGFSSATLGEDMELVLRLHEHVRPRQPDERIVHAADATCWTEAPSGIGPLRGQRIRWHVGLLDNLKLHRRLIGNPRFGVVGLISTPQSILFEVLSPPIMALGYVFLALTLFEHELAWEAALGFFILALVSGQAETAAALVIEDVGFHRYRTADLLKMAWWSLLEGLWFRPLTSWWRLKASILVLVGRRPGWGSIPRGAALGAVAAESSEAPSAVQPDV